MRARKLAIIFALLPGFAIAQNLPWIDLSGDWRIQVGDDARFADPAFDDSDWSTVRLPGPLPAAFGDFFWLRRRIDLSPGLDRTQLALTLGKLIENYELFVNGRRIWSSGFTIGETRIARPRTFDLPLVEGPQLSVAVRGWSHTFFGSTAWRRGPDTGPYLVTARANAPRIAERAFVEHLRMQRTLDLAVGVLLLTVAVILLLTFTSDRSRRELLWLGLCCGAVAWTRLDVVLSITMEGTPWDAVLTGRGGLFGLFFLQFLVSVLADRSRWIPTAAWLALVSSPFLSGFDGPWVRIVLFLLSMLVLARSVTRPDGRAPERLLVAVGALLVLAADLRTNIANRFILTTASQIPSGLLRIGPYEINSHPVFLALFTFLMVTVLIRRLLLDREQKQRLASEFEAARTVQQLLVSAPAPPGREYTIDATYEPAQEVGGDFYQVLDRADGSQLVLVGDVSGKGLKAAMLVSFALGALRREHSSSPAAILSAMNDTLIGHTGGGFVTCCCVRVDSGGRVTIANAGHPAPYLDGRELDVDAGLPLGVVRGAVWVETSATLEPGGQITILSDGVVEAQNAAGQLLGFDRTREMSGRPARDIAAAARAWGQNDDITVVTVRRSA